MIPFYPDPFGLFVNMEVLLKMKDRTTTNNLKYGTNTPTNYKEIKNPLANTNIVPQTHNSTTNILHSIFLHIR